MIVRANVWKLVAFASLAACVDAADDPASPAIVASIGHGGSTSGASASGGASGQPGHGGADGGVGAGGGGRGGASGSSGTSGVSGSSGSSASGGHAGSGGTSGSGGASGAGPGGAGAAGASGGSGASGSSGMAGATDVACTVGTECPPHSVCTLGSCVARDLTFRSTRVIDVPPDALFADLDGDGVVDYVTGGGSAPIEAHLGVGPGVFGAPIASTTKDTFTIVAVVDVDGDGHPDLVGTVASPGWTPPLVAGFARGDGTGHFAVQKTSTVLDDETSSPAFVDVNGDGVADLLAHLTSDDTSVVVALGASDGSFGPGTVRSLPIGPGVDFVTVGDFDEDGQADWIIGSPEQPAATLVRAAFGPTPSFTPIPIGYGADPVAVGDVNGDGHADFVALTGETLTTALGGGDGSFTFVNALLLYSPSESFAAYFAALADVDGDGLDDVVAYTASQALPAYSMNVMTARSLGDGTFLRGTEYLISQPDWPARVLVGKHDRAVLAGVSYLPVVTGDELDGAPLVRMPNAGSGAANTLAVDLDEDGRDDLVTADVELHVARSLGGGRFGEVISYVGDSTSAGTVLSGDFDGDGHVDLAVLTKKGTVYRGTGTMTLQAPVATVETSNDILDDGVVGDFDGDGNLDILAGSQNGVQRLHGHGDGTLTIGDGISLPSPICSAGSMRAADLDGDGHLDAVVPTSPVVLLLGGPNGQLTTTIVSEACCARSLLDVDGDGDPDLLAVPCSNTTGAVALFRNDGTGHFAPPLDLGTANSVPADFDGDGRVDLAGLDQGVSVALGLGDGTFDKPNAFLGCSPSSSCVVPYGPTFPVIAADFDGDGRTDLLALRQGRDLVLMNTTK